MANPTENHNETLKSEQDSTEGRAFPRRRQELLKWNGWGYTDSRFEQVGERLARFTGTRYKALSGEFLPKLLSWFETIGGDVALKSPSKTSIHAGDYPPPKVVDAFVEDIRANCRLLSSDIEDRVWHGHGHTVAEIFALRHGRLRRIPDLVVWPGCHEDVEIIVKAAAKHDVCIIPFGGGTSVSLALQCPENEERMIVSLDTTDMDKILRIDEENLIATIQAGVIGQDLDRKLAQHGFCTGHQPDSVEFSSLGGWVATRASGMLKNVYGNIEDLIISFKIATPVGTFEKGSQVPRMSAGPDIHHFFLGSEGTLGVVTEVTMKIKRLPEVTTYGSIVFPELDSGIACLREIAKRKCAPASIRLMDNVQFKFGQALKPGSTPLWTSIVDSIKAFYLLKYKQFDANKMCLCTLLFQGTREAVDASQKLIYSIASRYGGIPAGGKNGERGYNLTFVIAYLRDLAMDHYYIAESFETSVPWNKVAQLCRNVKCFLQKKCYQFGIKDKHIATCRVTQTYDSGACVYFYFGFNYFEIPDPIHVFEEIESGAREEILANGGSISHHHGIGQLRKRWLRESISPVGIDMLKAVKDKVDPSNVFGVKNLL